MHNSCDLQFRSKSVKKNCAFAHKSHFNRHTYRTNTHDEFINFQILSQVSKEVTFDGSNSNFSASFLSLFTISKILKLNENPLNIECRNGEAKSKILRTNRKIDGVTAQKISQYQSGTSKKS